MLKITPLFSGSHGNSTLIQSANANVLLDAGYGYRALVAKLNELSVRPQDISAIVITHEHSDHIAALKSWARHARTKIYAPQNSSTYIMQSCLCDVSAVNEPFEICDMHVDFYHCSHDARECLGYRFTAGNLGVASVTDTGVVTDEIVPFLSPCQTVMLESNHDLQMLWNGGYPELLKRRIASDIGHLSNDQCAEVLEKLIGTNVRNVVLAHLSEQNNTKQCAQKTAQQMYEKCGIEVGKDIYLYVADQRTNKFTI